MRQLKVLLIDVKRHNTPWFSCPLLNPICLPPTQSRAASTDASGLYTRLPGADVEAPPAAPAETRGDMQRTWTSLFLHACK